MSLFDFGRPSSITIIPQTPTPLLDSWRLDAAVSVSRSFPGAVSRHPVQSGREGITDAVRVDQDSITVQGILTDTPVAFGLSFPGRERASRMADMLEQLRAQRQALRVVSSWFDLRNRWISEFTSTRSAQTGQGIEISMTIEKLRIVRVGNVPQQFDSDVLLLGGTGPVTQVGEL